MTIHPKFDMLAIVGPTATGKTGLAARLAYKLQGEVVSADSRQVYRDMTIGTGKDYGDYLIDGQEVPVHLIDIVEAGEKYNVYEYQKDFLEVYRKLKERDVFPVLCGGTGLYVESVLKGYRLLRVPVNPELRQELEGKSLEELAQRLSAYKKLHNTTDIDTPKRAIRALEIEAFYADHPEEENGFPEINSLVVGVTNDREVRRERITRRLKARLEEGMIEEVQALLEKGVPPETLEYYGLEYKYLLYYIQGQISYAEMFQGLETAIHRFAKRQMTWFRGMERRGIPVHWIEGGLPMEEKVEAVVDLLMG